MSGFFEYLLREDTPFGVADLVYALLLLFGLVRGAIRGASGEIAATVGTFLTFLGAWRFHRPVGDFLLQHTRIENAYGSRALSYVLLALLFFAAWTLVTWLLRSLFEKAVPDQAERPLGAFLGAAKVLVFLCLLLMGASLVQIESLRTHLIERSAFGRATQIAFPALLRRWRPHTPSGASSSSSSLPPTPAPPSHGP